MKRFLLIALTAGLLSPIAANAERFCINGKNRNAKHGVMQGTRRPIYF